MFCLEIFRSTLSHYLYSCVSDSRVWDRTELAWVWLDVPELSSSGRLRLWHFVSLWVSLDFERSLNWELFFLTILLVAMPRRDKRLSFKQMHVFDIMEIGASCVCDNVSCFLIRTRRMDGFSWWTLFSRTITRMMSSSLFLKPGLNLSSHAFTNIFIRYHRIFIFPIKINSDACTFECQLLYYLVLSFSISRNWSILKAIFPP